MVHDQRAIKYIKTVEIQFEQPDFSRKTTLFSLCGDVFS